MGHVRWARGLLVSRIVANGCYWHYQGDFLVYGALFNQLTLYMTQWRPNHLHKRGNRVKVIEVCIVSVISSVISFGLPLFKKCTPCPEGMLILALNVLVHQGCIEIMSIFIVLKTRNIKILQPYSSTLRMMPSKICSVQKQFTNIARRAC